MKPAHLRARNCLSSLLAVGLLASLSLAQPDAPPPNGPPPGGPGFGGPGGPGGFGPPPLPVVEAIDKNKDGTIDAQELAEAASALRTLDKNQDGKLDEAETRPAFDFRRGGPGRGPGMRREPRKVLERFDADKDGVLNLEERQQARAYLQENPQQRGGPGGRGFGGPGFGGPGFGGPGGRGPGGRGPGGPGGGEAEGRPGPRVSPSDVTQHPDADLYDLQVLRTFFLEFEESDWEKALEEFRDTDVDIPARLTVDGKTYEHVGVRFRGNSSYGGVRSGSKRSLNLTVDLKDKKQSVGGYRTLNLLNAHVDPSFLRTVLFDEIASHYTANLRANHVRVVINGESWGVYVNEEQFNRDFAKSRFDDADGARWNVPVNFSGDAALVDQGDDLQRYKTLYEIKSKDNDRAWADLRELCRLLGEEPSEANFAALERRLNIDRALWFLALDSVLSDEDGYFSRGSDYLLYQDSRFGRFYPVLRDSNETFRHGGGGPGGPGGPGGMRRGGDPEDPLGAQDDERRPLARKLFANPIWKARYLAHVRTLANDWLDWKQLGPVAKDHHALIAEQVAADTRKLYSTEAFESSLERYPEDAEDEDEAPRGPFGRPPVLRDFVDERLDYLREHPAFQAPAPRVTSRVVKSDLARDASSGVFVVATVTGEVQPDQVLAYYSPDALTPFVTLPLVDDGQHEDGTAGDGVFGGELPRPQGAKSLRFYVEARAVDEAGTTAFHPSNTEAGALLVTFDSPLPKTLAAGNRAAGNEQASDDAAARKSPSVVISEVMATNATTIADPQGHYDDWIELRNTGSEPADLSGAYLTDNPTVPRKWTFPQGTVIAPGGYLLVWADEDGKDSPGLHASFKLSKKGETLLLLDADERQNRVLDSLEYAAQQDGVAFGRLDGQETPQPLAPTPGEANRAGE